MTALFCEVDMLHTGYAGVFMWDGQTYCETCVGRLIYKLKFDWLEAERKLGTLEASIRIAMDAVGKFPTHQEMASFILQPRHVAGVPCKFAER